MLALLPSPYSLSLSLIVIFQQTNPPSTLFPKQPGRRASRDIRPNQTRRPGGRRISLHLRTRKHHRGSLLPRPALPSLEIRPRLVRVLIVGSIDDRTLRLLSMNPSHRPRNHDRTPIAAAQTSEHAVLRDSVRRVEEIAAQSAVLEIGMASTQHISESPLVIVCAFSTHRLRDALPKPERRGTFARQHGAARIGMRVHAVRDGDVDGGVAEERENVAISVGIARENVGVEDERELEGEIGVVDHARVPLMTHGNDVAAMHRNDDGEQRSGFEGDVTIGDQCDVGGRVHLQNAPRVHIHLRHVTIAFAIGGIGVKDNAFLVEGGRRIREPA